MKPSTTLAKAREVISTPDKWCQEFMARDKKGDDVPPTNHRAVRFCLLGATSRATNGNGLDYRAAQSYLSCAVRDSSWGPYGVQNSVIDFNDDPQRTHAEAIAALDKARELALADGN